MIFLENSMKRWLSICFIFSFLFAASIHAQQTQSGTPKMAVDQETFDAGTIYKSEKLEHAFVIKNTGNSDLNILSATPG